MNKMAQNNWISNELSFKRTQKQQWPTKSAYRRLRFFGHGAGLPHIAPAKLALYVSIRKTKKPKGIPQTILINSIHKRLKELNINCLSDARRTAQDRHASRKLIARQSDKIYKIRLLLVEPKNLKLSIDEKV